MKVELNIKERNINLVLEGYYWEIVERNHYNRDVETKIFLEIFSQKNYKTWGGAERAGMKFCEEYNFKIVRTNSK